jgi:DNA polymerase-1
MIGIVVSDARSLSGPPGTLLRETLTQCGVGSEEYFIVSAGDSPNAIRENLPEITEQFIAHHCDKWLALGVAGLYACAPKETRTTKQLQGIVLRGPFGSGTVGLHPATLIQYPQFYPDFVLSVKQVAQKIRTPINPVVYNVVETLKDLKMGLSLFDAGDLAALDIETTGLNPHLDAITCIAIAGPGGTIVIPENVVAYRGTAQLLQKFLSRVDILTVGHNARFDSKFLLDALGVDWLWDYDTMLLHYLLDERRGVHGLGRLAQIYCRAPDYKINPLTAAPGDLHQYVAADAHYTRMLAEVFIPEVTSQGLLPVYRRIIHPADLALRDIELRGTRVDTEYLKQTSETYQNDERLLREMLPFNPLSPTQVAATLYEQMKLPMINGRKTDYETLKILQGYSTTARDVIAAVLGYREIAKTRRTYLDGLLTRAHPFLKTVHPQFLLHGTQTGRLACRNPNLQNIPLYSGPVVRNAFVARPGYVLVEADYSQLELRIAAHLSEDKNMQRIFREGLDIHSEVAISLFEKPADKISKAERRLAKDVVFGVFYGQGARSLGAEKLDCSTAEAQKYINIFMDRFPGFTAWQKRIVQTLHRDGEIVSELGRRRRFPLLTPANRSYAQRQAINAPIQSLASDICLAALSRIHNELRSEDVYILLTVHDSILMEVPEDRCAELVPRILQIMEDAPVTLSVPMIVKAEMGTRWGTMKEWSNDV